MSRSNFDKPFYVDVGTSIAAIRCASNHDVIFEYDHTGCRQVIQFAKETCDRMNKEVEIGRPLRNCDVLEEFTADDEFEKAMGFPPSKTADERDAIMRENWFLFKCWLFAESKGEKNAHHRID